MSAESWPKIILFGDSITQVINSFSVYGGGYALMQRVVTEELGEGEQRWNKN